MANFDSCVKEQKRKLRKNADPGSLYSEGIYEEQIARARCIEGFEGGSNKDMFLRIIKWAIIVLALWIIISLVLGMCKPAETINIEIRPLTVGTEMM